MTVPPCNDAYTNKLFKMTINPDNTLRIDTALGVYELDPSPTVEGLWYGVCNESYVTVSKESDGMDIIWQ